MKVLDTDFFKAAVRLCHEGWKKGWHERNGGNLSYRMRDEEVESVREEFKESAWFEIGTSVPLLADQYFLVTGSGKYMMNVKRDPEDTLCIIRLDEKGEKYQILWGLKNGGKPTSELPSHLMNLEVLKKRNPDYRVVYHCHATNLIALTFVLPLDSNIFTRELWEMATECPIVFPNGLGVVPWIVPGGREIAIETSKLMEKYDGVIWAHHGLFGAGKDFDETFGLVDTIEKSAEILVKVLSMTNAKKQTIHREDFIRLSEGFHTEFNEEVLNVKE